MWDGTDWEEIDKVVAGGNYGWPCYEGDGQQSGYAPKAEVPDVLRPRRERGEDAAAHVLARPGGAAVTGGVFLRELVPSAVPERVPVR